MIEQQATQIISRLIASFPGIEVGEETHILWLELLAPLHFETMRMAVNDYILSPGKKYFPTPGEVLDIYDKIYQDVIVKKIAAHQEDERQATKLLFHEPINQFSDNYVRDSVQLIRDVCNGEIQYKSQEWNQRFEGIYGGTASEYYYQV